MTGMRTRSVLTLLLALLPLAVFAAGPGEPGGEILVYRHGKILGYDKDVGDSVKEVLIESWSCETGALVKTERVEAYYHLSEDGEIITPRAICERCNARFLIEKKGTKSFFRGKKPPPAKDAPPPPAKAPEPATPAAAAVASKAQAALDADALAELEEKVEKAASEIRKIDPREVGSGLKRRKIIEDRGLAIALDQFKDDARALHAIVDTIEGLSGFTQAYKYYVLRSFGWQRFQADDARSAGVFFERCTRLIPEYSSGHYQFALVLKKLKDHEREIVELARALRVKPRAKYAKLLEDACRGAKPTAHLDAAALEGLHGAAGEAREKLEESPPDNAGAKKVIEATIGKLLDERFPSPRGSAPAEPEDEKP
jgi:tetratricopeptide (TPR) repeat protein